MTLMLAIIEAFGKAKFELLYVGTVYLDLIIVLSFIKG